MLCSENSFRTQLVHEPPKILEKTRLLVYRVFFRKRAKRRLEIKSVRYSSSDEIQRDSFANEVET